MKRIIPILLCIALMLYGCTQKESFKNPCSFYYLSGDTDEEDAANVFVVKTVEAEGLSNQELIGLYLAGTDDQKMRSPFPNGTYLVELTLAEDCVSVVLTDSFASLTGIDLTLACVCLGRTCMDMMQVQRIEIRCKTHKLNGSDSVILDRSSFCLQDTFQPDPSDPTSPYLTEGN